MLERPAPILIARQGTYALLCSTTEGTLMRLLRAALPPAAGEGGLTLAELLVVSVILGALAAISIPVYLNQKSSTEGSTLTANLRTTTTQLNLRLLDAETYGYQPSIGQTAGGLLVDLGEGGRFSGGRQTIVVGMPDSMLLLDASLDPAGWCVAVVFDEVYGKGRKNHQIEVTSADGPAPSCP